VEQDSSELLSSEDQAQLFEAQSAETMAGTAYWKSLMRELAEEEAKSLRNLADYLKHEPHPDREEVMTLCLKWFASHDMRINILRKVANVISFKSALKKVLQQYIDEQEQMTLTRTEL
jgi:hypothetical protein